LSPRDTLSLSRRLARLAPTPTMAMAQAASALKAQGRSVLDFSVGEPDQPTPPAVVAAGQAALQAGRTRYTPSAGLPELRAAVADAYLRDFAVRFEPAEVAVACGGKQALFLTAQALFGPGDEVIVPVPYWPTFPEAVRLAGAKAVLAPLDEQQGFRLTPQALRAYLTPKTRALVVNTPSNPTGVVVRPDDLLDLARLARRRKLTLLYDDTYARLMLADVGPSVLQEVRRIAGEHFVVLGTASKTYCMTGWRIGWVMGPAALAEACATLASHSTQAPATFAQAAAARALNGSQAAVRALVREYRRRAALMFAGVQALPGVHCVRPQGAFYVFPNVSALLSRALPSSLALAERLLRDEGVATVPGEGFGLPAHLRLSFARPADELREGLARIARFLARLERP
jgi:aspartate/methionine/tyrosine aminotransferase